MISYFTNVQYCYTYLIDQIPFSLLLYSHIPTALIALFFSIFVLTKKRSRSSIALFAVCISFSLWCLFDIISWFTFVGSANVMFFWSLLDLVALIMFFFSYYFLYTFITNKKLPLWQKITGSGLIAPTLISTFLGYNLSYYDSNTCTAIENGNITNYFFFAAAIFIIATISFSIIQYKKNNKNSLLKKEIILVSSGVIFFLLFFFSALLLVSLLAESSLSDYVYNYEIYGLFGMPILLVYLGYLIVKQHVFNIKAYGAQALVLALIALIGSEFFFLQSITATVLAAITLVITGFIGINLVRSVKKEITQREKIENLALRLEDTNSKLGAANEKLKELDQLKSEFVSLATHQIRAPLSAIKGYLSEVFEGDFGPITKELENPLHIVFQSTENLVNIVGDFLNISRIEQGKMKYELAPLDLKQVVTETVAGLKPNLDRVGLTLKMDIPDNHYGVYADVGKIKQVIGNLIDNSMKYTPKGGITISLSKNEKTQKVLFEISDTGIGIPAEVIPKLFQKFVRAKGANEVNIIGTGLGLYVAKLMIEGQGGHIWAESQGAGKGSQFYVELPIAHVS